MENIELREISKKDIRSCNNCSARNYESYTGFNDNKIVDNLYELRISTTCICLCRDCLEKLQNNICGFLQAHLTEECSVE